MITLILVTHVLLAVMSLAFAMGVIWGTRKHDFTAVSNRVKRMWQGTVAATLSGFILSFMSHSPIGQACLSSLSLITIILAAHYYQRSVYRRALSTDSLEK